MIVVARRPLDDSDPHFDCAVLHLQPPIHADRCKHGLSLIFGVANHAVLDGKPQAPGHFQETRWEVGFGSHDVIHGLI